MYHLIYDLKLTFCSHDKKTSSGIDSSLYILCIKVLLFYEGGVTD